MLLIECMFHVKRLNYSVVHGRPLHGHTVPLPYCILGRAVLYQSHRTEVLSD